MKLFHLRNRKPLDIYFPPINHSLSPQGYLQRGMREDGSAELPTLLATPLLAPAS